MAKKTKKEEGVSDLSKDAQVLVLKASNAVDAVAKVVIKNDKELEDASEMRSNVKKLQKLIKQEKDKALGPIKQSIEAIKGWFAPAEEKAEAALSNLNRAMVSYQLAREAENARKVASIAKRAEAGQLRPETAVSKMDELGEVPNAVKTEAGTSAFRKDKKMRIVDREKIPDDYWAVNEVALRAAALAISRSTGKLGEVIPGVDVYEETNVSGS